MPSGPDPSPSNPPSELTVNPLVAKLRETGGRNPAPFRGYVGAGAPAGRTRVHLNVNEPGYYVEFDNGDLVHSADLEESVMPFGAKAVWLKPDARVRIVRSVGTSARQVSGFLSSTAAHTDAARALMLHPTAGQTSGGSR